MFVLMILLCSPAGTSQIIERELAIAKKSKLTKQTYIKTSLVKDVATNQLLRYTKPKSPN